MSIFDAVSLEEITKTIDSTAATVLLERLALGKLAAAVKKPKIIVEIGTFHGGTTTVLRRFNPDADIYTVDLGPRDHAYKVAADNNINLVISDSAKAASTVPGEVGLIFIDGSHNIDDALRDWAAWAPRCVGATAVFHDYSPRFPAIRTLIDTLARTGRLTDAKHLGLIAFGTVAEPSAPTQAELEETMDSVAQWYVRLAETLTPISVSGKVTDVTADMLDAMPCLDVPIWIVGKGVRGVKTAAGLWRGYDRCIDSASAKDPAAFYVIAGSPEDEIRASLISNGVPACNILDPESAATLLSLFNKLLPENTNTEGPLTRALRNKLFSAFRGRRALLDRFKLLTHPDVSPNPDEPPIL